MEDRSLAALSQLAGIVAETAALPALLLPVLRIPVALGLIGFHVGNELIFHFDFTTNIVLIALVFLPAFEWMCRDDEGLRSVLARG